MFLNHRSTMIQAALVFMLLTVITRSAPCSTLQSCVDDATATNATLNVILPPILQASTGNCNVSIIGDSIFNRAVVSGSGSARTIIDCTASGLCLFPKRSAHAIHSQFFAFAGSRCLIAVNTSLFLHNIAFVGGATSAAVASDFVFWARSIFDFQQNRNDLPSMQNKERPQQTEPSPTPRFDSHFSALRSPRPSTADAPPMQSPPSLPPHPGSSGGCLAVFSPGFEVFMQDVSFYNCSALFGGGAYVLASSVAQNNVIAIGNTARQGGACFLYCNSSFINGSTFRNNSVATNISSSISVKSNTALANITSISDLCAAAGGALWLLSLTSIDGCTFSGNSAIAVSNVTSYNNVTATFFGSHALGSSVFALNNPANAVVRNSSIWSSRSHCTGWCFASGAVTVASSLGLTIANNSFSNCSAMAIASSIPLNNSSACTGSAFAVGSAVSVLSSDGPLSLINNSFRSCVVNATGLAEGGAVFLGAETIKYGFNIVGLSLQSTLAVCSTFCCFALGGGLYSTRVPYANLSLSLFENVGAITFASNSQAAGGGIYIDGVDGLFNISSSSFLSSFTRAFGSQSYAVGGSLAMPQSSIPVTISDCFVSNSSAISYGEQSAAIGGAIFNYAKFDLTNVTITECSAVCEGSQCFAAGGAVVVLNHAWFVADMPLLYVHMSKFSYNKVACNGTGNMRCSAQGGAIFFATSPTNNSATFVRTKISSSVFTGNQVRCSRAVGSVSNGGAISCNTCSGHVSDSLIEGNNVNSFLIDDNRDVAVEISGGGLYASLQPSSAGLLVSNTSFVKNSALFQWYGLSGSGGGATVGFMSAVTFVDCKFLYNGAHSGGGLAIESQGNASISDCIFDNNYLYSSLEDYEQLHFFHGSSFYSSRGSAIFSANPTISNLNSIKNSAFSENIQYPVTLFLQNSIIIESESSNADVSNGESGSLIFLAGVSQLFVLNTSILMHGAVSSVEISGVASDIGFVSGLLLSCRLGYTLKQQVSTSSLTTITNVPSPSTKFPPVPVSSFMKLSGLTSSCSACLANMYSFQNSASAGNQSLCLRCPFGAYCNGTWVVALPGFWGWIVSPSSANILSQKFVLLPEGYGCGGSEQCLTYDQCISSRSGVLCGACSEGFTRSLLSKSCVPISSCSADATAAWILFAITMVLIYAAVIVFPRQSSSAGVFQTLMWFYQVAGLLLSGSNSLDHIPGAKSLSSIISLIFNASPRYSSIGNFSGLCLAPNMSQVEILMVGVLFHLLLLAFVLVLSLNCVFIRADRLLQRVKEVLLSVFSSLCKVPCFDAVSSTGASSFSNNEVSMLDSHGNPGDGAPLTHPQNTLIGDIGEGVVPESGGEAGDSVGARSPFSFHCSIGRSLIMLLLTVFVSTMTALVQCTSCLSLPGFPVPSGESENRWYYDGSQECSGLRFTMASLFLVPLSTFPLILWCYMRKLVALHVARGSALTPIQRSALRYCSLALFPDHHPFFL
jgi:hypothetical protein